ncbi:Glutaredoxin [uncultured Gammaproteobacteria bacterium]|jgi:glutaredoxin|nr:Glutaredoxin [uncultured Gammaproteobacteria bacterium]CAC9460889.1 Glutaredoxin [uncultured Gammaproteobacteria bacterium]VVH65648.1 Glutaredoxin [uncultured Gammaproteobacteria bacterium]
MKLLLKGFRNGLGAIIALISWLIPVRKVKRGESKQQEVDQQTANIELYQFFGCPFCIKTRRVIRRLNLKIVTRDAQNRQGAYRAELLKATGKTQVPCLKITNGDQVEWMLETSQIIAYLEKNFG